MDFDCKLTTFSADRMHTSEIKYFLTRGINRMGLSLDNQEEVLGRLVLYFQELKKWNRKVNLIARTLDDRQVLENHFLDSLSLLTILDTENQNTETILDVGTGAGFPGMVLKVACPLLTVVLIEPRKNRHYFLKHIVRTLELRDVELLNTRLEETVELKELSGRKFSFITSRAFTDINRFVRLSASYLKPGGRIVCMKGPGAVKELEDLLQNNTCKTSYKEETRKFNLPFSKAERALVIFKGSNS